jgi:hypothetical protein
VKKMAMAEGVANEVVIGNAEDSCPPSHRRIHCIVKLGMMSFLTFFPPLIMFLIPLIDCVFHKHILVVCGLTTKQEQSSKLL